MLLIKEIKLSPLHTKEKTTELSHLKLALASKLRLDVSDIRQLRIKRKALDARKKGALLYVYTVAASIANENAVFKKNLPDVQAYSAKPISTIPQYYPPQKRVVVVGFGPAGIFAAWKLAKHGFRPLVLERGPKVDERAKNVEHFFLTGILSEQGNILFGEGGAGTFSDGKLTTLINDSLCDEVLEVLHQNGCDEEITYLNKPHIGTDVLRAVLKNLRSSIEKLGGEIRFNSLVTDIVVAHGEIQALIVNNHETIPVSDCLLGIGHSARDTFQLLKEKGISLSPKPFSIGVRIEHPQALITKSQYGDVSGIEHIGAADYKLVYHSPSGRTAYTFCMCPGGEVVNSSSEVGLLCTNGMSYSKRDGVNANSALLVNVTPADYPSEDPLAGIEFQRTFERKAFLAGGSDYHAPIQTVKDFLLERPSTRLGSVNPTFQPGVTPSDFHQILPDYVTRTMKEAILDFDKKLKGFAMDDALLTGVEARSSSPVRIERNEFHESSLRGLYPMGEGSGYSGGIMSSAVDGIKTATFVMNKYLTKEMK